jgi:Na+-translocating ferredoxin:NAD+ oxidoreductase subunit B
MSESLDLTRRKFMIASSVAIAVPFVIDMAGYVPAAGAATSKSTATGTQKTYYIGHECMGCQVCRMKCPAGAINYGDDRNEIDQSKCKHCGTCYRECPVSVISEC